MSSDRELPIVLVHGTMGKSEDSSRVATRAIPIYDQVVPRAYSEKLIPGAKNIELNSGQLIFLEKPVELGSAIIEFCNGKQAPSQTDGGMTR